MRILKPTMPDGYVPAAVKPRFLEWEAVRSKLESSLHYWLATTYPDGRPHVVPRWGVWVNDEFWYDGSPETRHVRNLSANTACVLHLESGSEAVIVRGDSQPSAPVVGGFGETLSAEFNRKYGAMGYTPGPNAWSDAFAGGLRCVRPSEVLAWTDFPADLTKFGFET